MMFKYKTMLGAAALMLAAASVFTGCKKEQKASPNINSTTIATQETTNVKSELDEGRSYTTGKQTDTHAYPVLVSIPNDNTARPHYNISKADVIYEMYVEGSITRLNAIYSDNMPEKVGPVRSARRYMVNIADDFGSAFVHYGGPEYGEFNLYPRLESSTVKYRLNGVRTSSHFSRDNARKAPNNAYVNLKEFAATITDEAPKVSPFRFSDNPSASDKAVNEITIEYSSSNKVRYKYDNNTGSYARFIGDKKFVDAADNSQLMVQNVIIQETSVKHYDDYQHHIELGMVGSGKATFYINGKMINGTWTKESDTLATVYKDENGEVIRLSEGNTFVQMVTASVAITNS